METEKLLLAAEISEYLHTLEGLQPLVWHQARGVAERIAEIAIAHLLAKDLMIAGPLIGGSMDDKWLDMDCMDVEYWQRQTEQFPASTYVWIMFRRAKATEEVGCDRSDRERMAGDAAHVSEVRT